MRLFRATVVADHACPPGALEHRIAGALWANATAKDLVEHIAVRVGVGRIHIGIFTRCPSDNRAQALVERALRPPGSPPPPRRRLVLRYGRSTRVPQNP
ncbi:hypothetical protein GCM10010112_65890 [Actinoplanes lobatus]|uniref:Uncharacterized protein n=1 Tax=Actinoplanes lobatus TaxID=113568 RepID=A0A7W7MJD1_9ACTN|nr:hypothetical protein [Actinoplanes lobatus]MBB4751935.1 hypothetical protein [Actinoplanes lobatus]GGN85450.1 hypothetical protein GCM10010112_65890 [Actinoplanes lobatus]GIE44338.1 hypothetical protein Alo02nite_72360 [Actinoplanes lobatus]